MIKKNSLRRHDQIINPLIIMLMKNNSTAIAVTRQLEEGTDNARQEQLTSLAACSWLKDGREWAESAWRRMD